MYTVPFGCVVAFGAVLAQTLYGEGPAGVEAALAVFFTASLASRAVLAWRSPLRRRLPVLWLSAAATVAGLALLAAGRQPALLWTAMAVLGVPHGLTYPIALALSADGVKRTELSWSNAALMSVNSLAAVLTPALLGAIATAVGYRDMILACLVPVLAFTAALGWQARHGRTTAS
jgi:MFS family permease